MWKPTAIRLAFLSWFVALSLGEVRGQPPMNGLQFWLDSSDFDDNSATENPGIGESLLVWKDRVGGLVFEPHPDVFEPMLV